MQIPSFHDYPLASLNGRTALVTGASAGIGQAVACFLASCGAALKLVARREGRLQQLAEGIAADFPASIVTYLAGDISQPDTWEKMEAAGFFTADILIDNAGLAIGREPIASSAFTDWERMIDINIKAAFEMVRRVLPAMQERGLGDIVCLSSIAAHQVYEGGSLYCATKHALRAFSDVLRRETCGSGIRVIQISPGMVETEFSLVRFGHDPEKARGVYSGMTPLTAEDIAFQIVQALRQPRHVNLDEIVIMADAQGGVGKVVRSS